MTSATISPSTILSLDPSSERTAWAALADDEQILETGRWTAGDGIEEELHELLERVQPGQVLIVLHGGADRACDVVAALELVQACERWAGDIEASGGERPQVIPLIATRDDAGGAIEAGLWWIREQRAGVMSLAGMGEEEGAR